MFTMSVTIFPFFICYTVGRMTVEIIYDLRWKHFKPNITSRLSGVFTEHSFCDVTLVSDDKKQFQAHRYVLSTSSPVLKDILLNNPHSHPLIYLRGVNHQELDSILQFIYLGKTSVNHGNMNRFTQAAKDLQIKKLAENIRMENPPESLNTNQDITNEDIYEGNEDQTEIKHTDVITILNIHGRNEQGSGKKLYKCEECEASYKNRSGLYLHASSKHEGIFYSCKFCAFKATRQSNIKIHQESIHDGLKYSCNQCGHHATTKSKLKLHKESIHEGLKYPCNQCDYHAKEKGSLKKHKESIHKGVKYSCDHCKYQATRRDHLKRHQKSFHKDIQYFA